MPCPFLQLLSALRARLRRIQRPPFLAGRRLPRPPRWALMALAILLTLSGLGGTALPLAPVAPPFTGVAANPLPENSADLTPNVIYQVTIDRFFDGDPSNNNPAGDTGLYSADHTNWHAYWGGDLVGLTEKLPYIAGLGVGAIWLSPVVENIHTPLYYNDLPLPQAGYDGSWARDDYQIDPHLGTWADFDQLVQSAHTMGIKVIIDFVANNSNPTSGGDQGNLYQDGKLVASYTNDTANWFHHNGTISNANDLYSDEYQSLDDLADLAQENPQVDAYLKGAIQRFLNHGVDGIYLDAVKYMPGGWLRSLNDFVEAQGPHFMVGNWPSVGTSDPLHTAQLRFANTSGIALSDFSMYNAIHNVFIGNADMQELAAAQQEINQDFLWPDDQPLFIDSLDTSRFLSLTPRHDLLHEALAFTLTSPGIPIISYGTEQYLYNTTDGGSAPYNHPMMSSFDTNTPAYQLISRLAQMRQTNPALAYGSIRTLAITHDVYLYERQFFNNSVIVAINRSSTQSATLAALATHLPTGRYSDVLGGQFGGGALLVNPDSTMRSLNLKPGEVAVWQFTAAEPATPQLGNIGPELTHPGDHLVLDGEGFGTLKAGGTVEIGPYTAPVLTWTAHSITVETPNLPGGLYTLRVCPFAEPCSNRLLARIDSGPQVPVTFTVGNVPQTIPSDQVYLTGDVYELGSESVAKTVAIPLLGPHSPIWFVLASVPACQTIHFHFYILHADGTRTDESGPEHTYTTPCSSFSSRETVAWQT